MVLTGYQAVGTRGRSLAEGAKRLKMRGRYVGVKAEIVREDEFSVHADGSELVGWIADLTPVPSTVFCTHGEPDAAAALAARITREVGVDAVVPTRGEVVVVEAAPAGAAPVNADVVARGRDPEPVLTLSPVRIGVSLGDIPLTDAQVEADFTPREESDGSIVLEGTITIRPRR